nr:succinylglutamate desuccinylase/aspartoacylase family protein [Planctomycetota bacterium]
MSRSALRPAPISATATARVIARPSELDLDSPGRRDYWVALEHDSLWGDHLIPLTVMIGPSAMSGEGLVTFGANHGDEYEGPVALKHLLADIDQQDVLGRIIVVPVLNAAAFAHGTRSSRGDDGVNLNRAFVDGAGRTPALAGITHRIAAFVREHIWPRAHVVIDLHAGGDIQFAPCVSFHPLPDSAQARAIAETAAWFGTPFLVKYQDQTPGLLPSEAERLGKIAIGGEFGWGGSVNPQGAAYARHGVRAAAIRHGQLRGEIAPIGHHRDGTQVTVDIAARECTVVAPFAGHYERLMECGQPAAKGQVIGLLHD